MNNNPTEALLTQLQDMKENMTFVVNCEQNGRVVKFTFERNGQRWQEIFLTMLNRSETSHD